MILRVTSHARLHLGFLDPAAGENSRRFGGIGFALEAPRFVLAVSKAEGFTVEGPHAERVEMIVERVLRLLELKPRLHVVVEAMERLRPLVEKTAGPDERAAFAYVEAHVEAFCAPVGAEP